MALIDLNRAPTRLDDPSFILNVGATDPIQIRCSAKQIAHNIDTEQEDNETFCRPGAERPGAATEVIELEVFLSHGDDGLFNILHPLRDQEVDYALLLKGGTALGTDNLEMSGKLYIPAVPFVNAAVRKNSVVTLTFNLSSIPVFNDTTPTSTDHAGL